MHRSNWNCRVLSLLAISLLAAPSVAAFQDSPPPEKKTGLLQSRAGVTEGYTLIAPLGSTETFLIDMQGEIVHAWGSELAPGGPVYLLDNGNLMRPGRHEDNKRFQGGGIGGRLQEFDWDGDLLWDYLLVDDKTTEHHDIAILPSGNVLVIVWKHHSPEEVIAAGRDPEVVIEDGLWSCSLLEIKPILPDDGEIVWEWHSWDHLIQDFDDKLKGYGSIPDHPERIDMNADFRDRLPLTEKERERLAEIERQMAALGYSGGGGDDEDGEPSQRFERGKRSDWLHTNSVNHNEELDLVVVSSPNMNEIWVIDHSTTTAESKSTSGGRFGRGGDLLYRWGNPRNYGAGGESDRKLFYQHDPQWLGTGESGDLRMLLYNNGRGRPDGDYSTAIELLLPFSSKNGFTRDEGKAYGPSEPLWTWGGPGELFSPFISGVQRFENGNTLICEGANGRLIEVTKGGEVVWEYVNEQHGEPAPKSSIAPPTKGGALFRATRILKDAPALLGRDLD
ncbi:MAG: hypothetical protein ACI8X5_002155 [Planctomycetota bacterium]|jgi:hypothetical protein